MNLDILKQYLVNLSKKRLLNNFSIILIYFHNVFIYFKLNKFKIYKSFEISPFFDNQSAINLTSFNCPLTET